MIMINRMRMVVALACLVTVLHTRSTDAQTVGAWLTTDDQTEELQPQAPVTFCDGRWRRKSGVR